MNLSDARNQCFLHPLGADARGMIQYFHDLKPGASMADDFVSGCGRSSNEALLDCAGNADVIVLSIIPRNLVNASEHIIATLL